MLRKMVVDNCYILVYSVDVCVSQGVSFETGV